MFDEKTFQEIKEKIVKEFERRMKLEEYEYFSDDYGPDGEHIQQSQLMDHPEIIEEMVIEVAMASASKVLSEYKE